MIIRRCGGVGITNYWDGVTLVAIQLKNTHTAWGAKESKRR